ncbi:uncharacterized protein LOC116303578, partial [Actinia tenebrosa]|uniref:Uncharacterized protein LOC116303578 n=1 Tax=Actinia tenebrosa TaxID=6105 RepID=A0A6P8IQ28_ACTTE
MLLKYFLVISTVVVTFVPYKATGVMVNPVENTEEGTGPGSQPSGQHKAVPISMSSRSGQRLQIPPYQECFKYTILSNADHAQEALTFQPLPNCDPFTPGWYRFSGDAGDKMPSTCVPYLRCGTLAPGWMNANHPLTNGSIIQREVCFNWNGNCCEYKTNIRVRNRGHFYVYEFPITPNCWSRYCGNALGPLNKTMQCGGNLTSLTGQITSPGYPNYMEPITCHWTIKSPFDGNILLYFENITLGHGDCSSNSILVDTNGQTQTFCTTQKDSMSVIGQKVVNIHCHSTGWKMKAGFKVRYAMVNGNLENAETQSKWNISVKVNGSSAIEVSWQALNGSFLKPSEYVYGYVVVCKPVNQRSLYVLTEPDTATISISGLTGGTEYKVQVVALVSGYGKKNIKPMFGSNKITVNSDKGECKYYNNLTSWDRAQGVAGDAKCDRYFLGSLGIVWYRFSGMAGTQIATSCVPKSRCGTAAPGWMSGTHPAVRDGIVTRTVCYHWIENCCTFYNTIKVRNCGGFYVYKLYPQHFCNLRYCGNKGGCGKSINDTSGTLTSPGYPTRIYWNSKCQWNFTAPSPSGVIVVIVEHLSIPISSRCLVFNLTFEDSNGLQIGKVCGVRRFITWMSRGSAKLRFHSSRATSRWVGFKARYFVFSGALTNIPESLQWPGVSVQPISSTAITVQWGPHPALPGSPSVTEYLIICVPDGLPLNATVFTTDISQNSLVENGLMKYTNYTTQIVVQNSQNNFQYLGSQKIYKTTSEDVPSEGPANISAIAKGNAMMVSWQPIPKLARNGIITYYVIFYKKAWTSENWAEMNVGKPTNENMPMTAYLRGLEPATEYRIQIAGVTTVGVGTKSKAVFAISGCDDVKNATGNQFTWTFSSPRHPGNYLSNLDCTWQIFSEKKMNVYVVFYTFHVEDGCSDKVVVKQADGKINDYCGKKDPFAVKLSSEAGFVKLKTDGGLEESGFLARVFAVTNSLGVQYDIEPGQKTTTITFSLQKYKGSILEYVVLYKKGSSSDLEYNVTLTTTNKAILTGLELRYEYQAFVLIHTTKGVFRGPMSKTFGLLRPSATPGTKMPEPTSLPKVNEKLGMYLYGVAAGDSLLPNTHDYSTRCFTLDIPDDGMQFFTKRHHKIHICRNGLLLFETPQLIRWPHRFSEQHELLRNAAMLAPYWALTDVEDSFVTLGISKVYYQEYKDTDNSWESKTILPQASYHVKNHFDTSGVNSLVANFKAKWVLKVTWVDLRFPSTTKLALSQKNTFQAVVMTDGTLSFAMYNYPPNGIQWAAPTQRKYYSLYAAYNNHGLPVVGFNSGEHNRVVPRYYDVIGSGTPGIVNINQLNGSTVYPTNKLDSPWDFKIHESPGTWFFRLEDINRVDFKQQCIDWYKREPDHRKYTEHLEPCPCTYRQAWWDERFEMDPQERHRICAYTVFKSVHGWGQECCYERSTGALIKGYPDGGTARKQYLRVKKTIKENEYITCCIYSNMCHLYYKRRPTNNCFGYKETEWSWLWGDPHFVTLDGLNYTFNGLGEYIMADISNGLFQLQARTKLVEGGGKATVFVSAVARQTGTSAVQVNLKSDEGLEVLVNGTVIDHSTLTNTTTRYNGSVALSRPDNTSITVLFPCGISVKMTDVKDSLAILLAAPERFKNKTRGLLGVWNDDPEDDLTTPTGRVLPTNATGRMLHYEFGQK